MSDDTFAEWDAAYVLGALTAVQRSQFEEHLATCERCRAAVAELAGIPGLLAQVPPGEVLAMDIPDHGLPTAPPASLLPMLPARRRRWATPLAAAAAALLIGGVGGYAASSASRSPSPSVTTTVAVGPGGQTPARLAFSPVGASTMTAVVDVLPAGTGTELRVECQYALPPGLPSGLPSGTTSGGTSGGTSAPRDGRDYARIDYAIWVVDRSGRGTQLKEWTARPDRVMHPKAVSKLPVAQIGSVEIRRVDDGRTVMRAALA
jgi:hypothetical protein